MIEGIARAVSCLAVSASVFLGTGCSRGDEEAPVVESARFERCQPPHGGGYDIWVQGMDCAAITRDLLTSMPDAFGRYRSLPKSKRQVSNEGKEGWVCWSALEGDFGPIHNVCRKKDRTLIFYEG